MKLHKLIFQTLIFLLPTQLALHFWPDWAFVSGIRVDYLAPTIYLTDILLFLLISLWLIEDRSLSEFNKIKRGVKYVLVGLIFFGLVNILTSSAALLSLYKWIKVLEFLAFSFYIYVNYKELLELLRTPLSFAIIYSALIAIMQFLLQRTIGGLFYLLGERSFTSLTPGIALFNFFGKALLRPYGTFGHPNALGGFLLVAVFMLLVQRKNLLNWIAICLGSIVLFLTFSQNVSFAFFAGVILLLLRNKKEWGRVKNIT
ncbi:MAG TPA: hypothetical protein VF185_02210, partial [Patescibacteria group bacterium]